MRDETSTPAFILPPRAVFREALLDHDYGYALSNYYGRGPIARGKRARFRIALEMGMPTPAARRAAAGQSALDMGSADGIFLPTLCRHYRRVVAVEHNPQLAGSCRGVIDALQLHNAESICNHGMDFSTLRRQLEAAGVRHGRSGASVSASPSASGGFDIVYLLETLEHIGAQPDIWSGKMDFLRDCLCLLNPGGIIVISVPRMTGPIVIFKNLLQRALGLRHDALTLPQLFRSGILRRTDELEPLWVNTSHVGFNERKLDGLLAEHFHVVRHRRSAISAFYAIQVRA